MFDQPNLYDAQRQYLRVFCDVFFPQIFDLAISQHNDSAISLLGFKARHELQTPKWSEMTVTDFWQAMLDLAPLLPTPAPTPPSPPPDASAVG